MRVAWIGMDDSNGCVLQWHELRCHLRDSFEVILVGDGYSQHKSISEIEDDLEPDWIVLDDCNAMGYPRIRVDRRPSCKVAWREHDWHNRQRQSVARRLEPDLILGCVDRPRLPDDDPFRDHSGWRLVPHPVNTNRFYPWPEKAHDIGFYGKTGKCYSLRSKARTVIAGMPNTWIGRHGGYWRDGRGSAHGMTWYNDELASVLRSCRALWVDGSDYNVFLQKYHEGAASGCLLIGKRPFRWESYYPKEAMIDCEPDELPDLLGSITNEEMEKRTTLAWEHCTAHHSIEARAAQIMEVLG